ncbi:MAG: type I-A CRISPR-associated protein Csa5 [Nitrososphaerota archaeon]
MGQEMEFDDVSRIFAAVTIATGSYSLIDRVSNALTPDPVNRAIYDLSRNLEALSRGGETYIKQIEKESGGKKHAIIEIKPKDGAAKTLWGYLARPERLREFQKAVESNITIARKVAAYAMYLVAYTDLISSEKEVEKQ